jgi:mono/diheme cytochrome c family protein
LHVLQGTGWLIQEAAQVMSGYSRGRVARRLAMAFPFFLAGLTGCGDGVEGYPSELKYLPRTDPLVVDPPKITPVTPDNPGELDKAIALIGIPEDKGGVGGKALDPSKVPLQLRNKLQTALEKVFGKPAAPTVKAEDEDAQDYAAKLKLDKATLVHGSVQYRRHCLHCHGLDGDGRGPTGPWLNPHPRDYRRGRFKFISSEGTSVRKPRREDLIRTLKRGVDGTSMPSFGLQLDDDLESLVSYVIHLSLRGEIEFDALKTLAENDNKEEALEGGTFDGHIKEFLKTFLQQWADADKVNTPAPYTYTDAQREESVRRGYALFTDTKGAASCISCHIDFGRQVPFRYDDWGTLVRPANLTAGMYRGGRRPIDLYWRIRGGIPPSGMPGAELKRDEGKKIDEYWDLINFVQALPYPKMLPDDVRDKIYGSTLDSKGEPRAAAD